MLYDEMGVSQTNFHKKISNLTGQNASYFMRTIKLKYAAELLVENPDSIKEISYRAGFNTPAYFIKTFKELYGVTPGQYIKQKNEG